MAFSKKEKPVINFISRIDGLETIEAARPVPANKFVPDWWKKVPFYLTENEKWFPDNITVKQCPAFSDLFSSGYILPMWADTVIRFNSKTQEFTSKIGRDNLPLGANLLSPQPFQPYMFSDYTEYTFLGSKALCTFQFINPWDIITSPGYEIFQMPLFYHHNSKWSILPGTYDGFNISTDKLEAAIFVDDEEIFIKQGTPLVQYIPYKRDSFDLNIRSANDEDILAANRKLVKRHTIFKNWYAQNRNR